MDENKKEIVIMSDNFQNDDNQTDIAIVETDIKLINHDNVCDMFFELKNYIKENECYIGEYIDLNLLHEYVQFIV